ncbi:MAG: hypothetical protein AABY22_29520 [Nanoarchaeota archaeon]
MNPELIILHENVIKRESPEEIGSIIPLLKKRSHLAVFSDNSLEELEINLNNLDIKNEFELIHNNLNHIVTNLNFNPEATVVVSDSIDHLNEAKNSGVNFIAIEGSNKREEFNNEGCFIVLNSLADLI